MSTVVTTFTTVAGFLIYEDRGGTESSYTPDPLGSLIECRDSSGNKTYSAGYWPYGEVQTSTGSNPSSWGFGGLLGYFTDTSSRLYVRARYLVTAWARWLTLDPLWPQQQAFVYVEDSPVLFADPSGLARRHCAKSFIDCLLGFCKNKKLSNDEIAKILKCIYKAKGDVFKIAQCLMGACKEGLECAFEYAACSSSAKRGFIDPCSLWDYSGDNSDACCGMQYTKCVMIQKWNDKGKGVADECTEGIYDKHCLDIVDSYPGCSTWVSNRRG